MAEVKISATPDGPYKVEGPIELYDQDGTAVQAPAGSALFLCRCGASANKPFCDGTHSKIGFRGARQDVAESE